MIGQTLIYSNRKLTRFPDIPGKTIIEKLDLSNNKIVDFTGIRSYQKLKQLVLDFNPKFSSFRGIADFILPEVNNENKITTLNSLTNFSCQKTPLGNSPNIVLMATIVFGENLKYVNGITISNSIYKLASSLRNEIFDLLINGWIVTSTNPIRILNVDSRKRKIIYPHLKSNNNKTQKKKERKNNTVETSSGVINVYLESDDDSSNSENIDQELSYSTNAQSRSPTKGNKNSQEDNHSLINGLKQNPNQELLNMKLAEKQEKWLKKKELLQRGVAAHHEVKSSEKAQKQQKNTEEEEEEIDEKEKEESKRLRERFNEIHDQFLNTIGPIFNNNNEYIVYNTTPGSPSQSRLGRTHSQATNYSPAQSPRNKTRSQAANYSSNQSPRDKSRSQAANYSSTQSPHDRSRSQAANYSSTQSPRDRSRSQATNYSPNKTQPNESSTEKITTGTPMKMLIRDRKKRKVSVKKESPFPRNDFFTQQRAKRQASMNNLEEEFYEEEDFENPEEYGQEEMNYQEELENPEELENQEKLYHEMETQDENHEELYQNIATQEENHEELNHGIATLEENHEELNHDIATQEENHEELNHGIATLEENHDELYHDIDTQEENHEELNYGIATQEENHDELNYGIDTQEENHEELNYGIATQEENHDELNYGIDTQEEKENFNSNENLGEVDTIDAILQDDDDGLGLGDSLMNIINQNENASGSENSNLE